MGQMLPFGDPLDSRNQLYNNKMLILNKTRDNKQHGVEALVFVNKTEQSVSTLVAREWLNSVQS